MAIHVPRCYLCGAYDGVRGAFVSQATVEEAKRSKVPAGVGLCSNCAVEAPPVPVTPQEAAHYHQLLEFQKAELREDLEEDFKEWARWSNKFGGW